MGPARGNGRVARDARRARAGRSPRLSIAGLAPDVIAILFGLIGLAWGFVADRIAARWPAHEDGSVRAIDWRTPVVMVIGAVFLWALPARAMDAGATALFAAWFLVLQLLLATDLDQRLLPDVITLPMIPVTFAIAALGWSPLVPPDAFLLAIVAAVAIPSALFALSIPFGAGAIGLGDIKLLVSVGLLTGLQRAVLGVVTAALLSGAVVILLLATRRVTLKSYIPFGPFLIVGAFWSVLLRT